MFFNPTPLRDKIIKLILNNPIPYRNTDIINPYLILSITFFFSKYKSVILDELYNKGLIQLHGDVDLFIKATKASDTKYLSIAASITPKGMAYYKLHMQSSQPKMQAVRKMETTPNYTTRQKNTLSIVR